MDSARGCSAVPPGLPWLMLALPAMNRWASVKRPSGTEADFVVYWYYE